MRIASISSVPAQPTNPTPSAPASTPVPASQASSFQASGDANAMSLVGLSQGKGAPALIKQLQDDLVSAGVLDASVRSNPGYGNTFGPMTAAAVRKLQAQNGLSQTGIVDSATAKLLLPQTPPSSQPPSTPPAGFPGAPAGDAQATALAGLAPGATNAAGIKQLQDDLVRMGALDGAIASNAGYGHSFGPLTQAGLKAFQDANGLPQTGVVDAATVAALQAPRPPVAPIAAGAAQAFRSQIGLPAGPLTTETDGSVRQPFDNGYVMATPEGTLYVVDSSGQTLSMQKLGAASSLDQANQSFLSQWGPTPWNSAQGAPYGYEDCGPTSCAMVLSSLGLIAHPSPADAEKTIDAMRDAALGYNSTHSQDTDDSELVKALKANGAQAVDVAPVTQQAVDAALAEGHPLIIGSGDTWAAWGKQQCLDGKYLNHQNPGGHYVTVLGRASDGNYIVGDPLSSVGAIEATPAQLKTLLGGAWSGIEVARS
ncbi:MAG: peptidoglycan-binding protein [Deltaproteobacteria bacterium]|nr:peptidoglycan-binding protein [Deltaproteobacteria bacterium]